MKYTATAGATYRIRACTTNVENYTVGEWSESFTYTVTLVKLDSPTFDEVIPESSGDSLVYWNGVANASGYNYKIGEDGTLTNKKGNYVALSKIPVGEKLYVQACGDGVSYEDSDWVMIYENTGE